MWFNSTAFHLTAMAQHPLKDGLFPPVVTTAPGTLPHSLAYSPLQCCTAGGGWTTSSYNSGNNLRPHPPGAGRPGQVRERARSCRRTEPYLYSALERNVNIPAASSEYCPPVNSVRQA